MIVTGRNNLGAGSALSFMLLLPTLTAFLAQRFWVSKKSFVTVTGKPNTNLTELTNTPVRRTLSVLAWAIMGFILCLYLTIFAGCFVRNWGIDYSFTLDNWGEALSRGWTSIRDTVLLAGIATPIAGILAMAALNTRTLILCPNVTAVHQWIRELLDKTYLTENEIGEYSGEKKDMKPVTVCTYQIVTWRPDTDSDYSRFSLFRDGGWGFIIYDEVHMLPAPVFRITAELQAIHRLGLTATLVREDGREDEVFSLVGPKRYDTPWSELEAQGFIAKAYCHEIRLPLPEDLEIKYAVAKKREKYRFAAENPLKAEAAKRIIREHEGESILIIGQYLEQLESFRKEFGYPIITGSTPTKKRDELYALFREGKVKVLIVSKVANSAIDLPDASVAIQISGTFGSRQEEAQRLGRILRPKDRDSHFYTLVTEYTEEEEFAQNRQKFLSEQGYSYTIEKVHL